MYVSRIHLDIQCLRHYQSYDERRSSRIDDDYVDIGSEGSFPIFLVKQRCDHERNHVYTNDSHHSPSLSVAQACQEGEGMKKLKIAPHSVKRYSKPEKTGIGLLALLLFVLVLFPFYWIILTSFKDTLQIYDIPPSLIPKKIDFMNYIAAFTQYKVGMFLGNSLKVTVMTVLGTTFVATPAAYSLARLKFKGSAQIKSFLGITQMFPVVVLLVPLFIFCNKLNLYNSHGSLILPYIAMQTPVSIILQMSYFVDVPKEMEEAAVIDGCSLFQSFFYIMLPLVISGIVATSIYTFIQVWQEFLIASSFITSRDLYTLTVGLSTFKGDELTDWGALMATSVIIAIPAMILFTSSQDFFINRLAGGVKE